MSEAHGPSGDLLGRMEDLAWQGKHMEGGWASFEAMVVNPDAGPEQRADLRGAFFSGGWYLFQVVMECAGRGTPTRKGLAMMDALKDELDAFMDEMRRKAESGFQPRKDG